MECKNCKKLEPFKCGGFPTHDFFMEAHAQIEAMKDTGELNPLSQYDFQCTACRARWEPALPDNAYRGFLRVVSERAQRIGAIRRITRQSRPASWARYALKAGRCKPEGKE